MLQEGLVCLLAQSQHCRRGNRRQAIYKNTWTGAMEGINPAAGPVSTRTRRGQLQTLFNSVPPVDRVGETANVTAHMDVPWTEEIVSSGCTGPCTVTRTPEKSTSREKSVRRVKSVSGVPQGSVLGPFTIYLLCL